MKRVLAVLLLTLASALSWGQANNGTILFAAGTSGTSQTISNTYGALVGSFEEVPTGTVSAVSITIQGCMRNGTCDSAADTYTGTTATIRSVNPFTKAYNFFKVTATWTGSGSWTISYSVTTAQNSVPGGSGTVTNVATGTGLTGGPVTTTGTISLLTQYTKNSCQTGLGDGLNAIPAGTYIQFFCVNDSGVTRTITGIHCWTDNAGSSTLAVANNAGTALLTGAVTCNNTKTGGGAAGTQSATVTLASNDAATFTFVADGTTKQTTFTVSATQ